MKVDGKTNLLGLFGNPVAHTLSPVIHNTISEYIGNNAVYVPLPVEDPEKLDDAVKGCQAMGFKGMNVTVPYKADVMKSLVEIDEVAAAIGAVNTLVPAESGYKGYNTDMPGLYRALQTDGVEIAGKKAVVLGAGGASRAVCYMLRKYGAESIFLLNRSVDKAEALAGEFGQIKAMSLSDYKNLPDDEYICFQCSSLGLKDGDGLLIDDDEFYKKLSYGYDLIYKPGGTPFTKKLASMNISCSDGLSMLLYQGIIAYELWFNIKLSDDAVNAAKAALVKAASKKPDIVLIGYMGCGKTTVGKALAEKLDYDFIDTDALIEEKEGRSISDIFAVEGESAFRDMETELLKELAVSNPSGAVISCGGGIVLRKENHELLKKLGRVIYLKASAETTFERVKGETSRPLLTSQDEAALRAKIEDMLKIRGGYYETAADETFITDGKSVDEITKEILVVKEASL